jgi:hypothetical protein
MGALHGQTWILKKVFSSVIYKTNKTILNILPDGKLLMNILDCLPGNAWKRITLILTPDKNRVIVIRLTEVLLCLDPRFWQKNGAPEKRIFLLSIIGQKKFLRKYLMINCSWAYQSASLVLPKKESLWDLRQE